MQTQHNLSKVLRSIGPKGRIAITRNKKVVAELVRRDGDQPPIFPDFASRARDTWWGSWESSASSDDLLDQSRGDR